MSLLRSSDAGDAKPKAQLVEASANPGGTVLINPHRTTKHATSDLVALATEIEKADSFTRANVGNKLQVIAEQVRFLREQAHRVLEEANENKDLHEVACNFVKQPGNIYSLYRRPSGQRYFSMISQEDWGGDCPHEYLGAYRLEADQSWTPSEKIQEKNNDVLLINKILDYSSTAAALTEF